MKIEIEKLSGAEEFRNAEKYLIECKCPKDIMPYENEFEMIYQNHKSIAENFGLVIYKQNKSVLGYVPYIISSKHLNIRLGEKTLFQIKYKVIQILRPNSEQYSKEPIIIESLLEFCATHMRKYAIFVPELHTNTLLWKAIKDKRKRKNYNLFNNYIFVHHFHVMEKSYEKFYESLSRNSKRQIKRNKKKIEKKVGEDTRFVEYTSEEDVEKFLAAANTISVKTYQARLFGEVVENTKEDIALYRYYARLGFFRSFIFWIKEKPISFLLGFQTPDGVYDHAIMGYDPNWMPYGPGFRCNVLFLEKLYEKNSPICIDFGGGDSQLKRLMANNTRESVTPILFCKTFKGTVLFFIGSTTEMFNRKIVLILERIGIKNTIKKWFRK